MNARQTASSVVVAALLVLFAPALVHACPMCFNGNNQNQSAFLYGSLMLMFVPTITIGSLLYWAWCRARANAAESPPAPPPASEALLPPTTAEAPALRAVGRG
jgi:hypothetical protein